MGILQIQNYFGFFCAIEIIFQILLLHLYRKRGKEKDFGRFLGITIAVFVSNIAAFGFFVNKLTGLGSFFFTFGICGFSTILNTVLLITGCIIRKVKNTPSLNINKSIVLRSALIFLICNSMLLFVFPVGLRIVKTNNFKGDVEEFLINRYGNHNYKFIKTNERYDKGTWEDTFSGYTYTVEADCIKDDYFIVEISDTGDIVDDNFLETYYSQ